MSIWLCTVQLPAGRRSQYVQAASAREASDLIRQAGLQEVGTPVQAG